MSIQSDAHGISERHRKSDDGRRLFGHDFCESGCQGYPCPDRLAADNITARLTEAITHLEALVATTSQGAASFPNSTEASAHRMAVAALASLTGDKP